MPLNVSFCACVCVFRCVCLTECVCVCVCVCLDHLFEQTAANRFKGQGEEFYAVTDAAAAFQFKENFFFLFSFSRYQTS